MVFFKQKTWLIFLYISISTILIAADTTETPNDQLNGKLLNFQNDITQLKSSKNTLTESESLRLKDLEQATEFIKQITKLQKQVKNLEQQILDAPKETQALDKRISEFTEIKFNRAALKNLSLEELEQKFTQHEKLHQQLKKQYTVLNQESLSSKTQRDSSQSTILKNLELLSSINTKKTNPTEDPKSSSHSLIFEEQKIEAENTYLRQQQSSFLVLNKLRATKKTLLEKQTKNYEVLNTAWKDYLASRREVNMQNKVSLARSQSQEMTYEAPQVKAVFERNLTLVQQLKEINSRSEEITKILTKRKLDLEGINKNFSETKEMTSRRILNEMVGIALRQRRNSLNKWLEASDPERDSISLLSDLERSMITLNQELKSLINIKQNVDSIMTTLKDKSPEIVSKITGAYKSQVDYILQLQDSNQRYFDAVHALSALEEQIILEVVAYQTFIKGQLFWIPSSEPMSKKDLQRLPNDLKDVLNNQLRVSLNTAYSQSWHEKKSMHILYIVLILALGFVCLRFTKISAKLFSHASAKAFSSTLKMLTLTIIISLFYSTLFHYGSFIISAVSTAESPILSSLTQALQSLTLIYFFATLFVNLFIGEGLGIKYFKWEKELCLKYYKFLHLWLIIILPFLFLAQLSSKTYSIAIDNISKFGLIGNTLIVLTFFLILLCRKNKYLPDPTRSQKARTLIKFIYFCLLITLITILYLAWNGYFYSAFILKGLMVQTILYGSIIFIFKSFILFHLQLRKQKLAEISVRKTLAIKETEKLQIQHEVLIEQQEHILENKMSETRKGYSSLIKILLYSSLFYIWKEFFPVLNILDQFQLWNHVTELDGVSTTAQVTLKNLFIVSLLISITFYGSSAVPNIIKVFILNKLELDEGKKFTIITILKYIIVTAGLFYSFEKLGVNWSEFQWLVAALSVGLGFGLQEIVANFVSGLIVLFERPYRVGDIVTVGQTSGTVSRIQIRATTIRDWDRRELIIPNKSFITGEFINWSLSDSISRVVIALKVTLDSDIKLIHKTLQELGNQHENTLTDPAPQVFVPDLASDGIYFELRFFVPASKYRLSAKDELFAAIHQKFIDLGIDLARPHYQVELQNTSS